MHTIKIATMIKLLLIATVISLLLFIAIVKISEYLDGKPKSHKFRQWWSNHIVDLDKRYE